MYTLPTNLRRALLVVPILVVPAALGASGDSQDGKVAAASATALSTAEALREAVKGVVNDGGQKPETELPLSSIMRRKQGLEAQTLAALGLAQATIGEKADARSTLQSALELANRVNNRLKKSDTLCNIANAQILADDTASAGGTIAQSIDALKPAEEDPRMPDFDMEFRLNPELRRIEIESKIAATQATLDDREGSRTSFRTAVDEADGLTGWSTRISALAKLAVAQDKAGANDDAKATWDLALTRAKELGDDYRKGLGVEIVLSAKMKSGKLAEALKLATESFDGDLRNFLVWAVADEIMVSHMAITAEIRSALVKAVEGAKFEKFSRRARSLARVGEILARDGDLEAATALTKPLDAPSYSSGHSHAKFKNYQLVAAFQLKAGDRAGAEKTLRVLLEQCDWFVGPDGLHEYMEWSDVVPQLAGAGFVDEAIRLAGKMETASGQASIVAQLAFERASAGDLATAKRLIAAALQALEKSPIEGLWRGGSSARSAYFSDTIHDSAKFKAVLHIAEAQTRVGDAAAARKTAELLPAGSYDRENRSIAVARIAEIQATMSDFAGALATLEAAPQDPDIAIQHPKSDGLARLARTQAEAADAPGVFTWVQKFDDAPTRHQMFQGMAEGTTARAQREK